MASKDEVRELLFNPENGIVTIARQSPLGDKVQENIAEVERFFADNPKSSKKRRIF